MSYVLRQREAIIRRQLAWAESAGLDVDPAGQVPSVQANLFSPLAERTRAELATSVARPLGDGVKPGPLQCLYDGAALRLNAFEFWRARAELPPGLFEAGVTGTLRYSVPVGDGSTGRRAEVDCLAEPEQGVPTAITTRFIDADQGDALHLRPDLEDRLASLPSAARLHGVRLLAQDLAANPRRYRVTPVGRLLDLAVGLCEQYGPRGYRIVHVWHAAHGRHGRSQYAEFARLLARIGGEVALHGTTWQAVFAAIMERPDADRGYTDYIAQRYTGAPQH